MPNITNPGLVNVANQGDGMVSVDQSKTVAFFGREIPTSNISRGGKYDPDSTNSGLINVVTEAFGKGLPLTINAS